MLKWIRLKVKCLILLILTTNTSINDTINEVESEIPNITNLATTNALNAVKNKIPKVI